ncbi:MAG: hypothetical protein FWB85_01165 [Chitinispirillia bacterium]|nr:hypothetical protein [Chitinispirillia bacterium]MCL2241269.1 hypothetical protein [Chitinispirillia bacterium]
MSGRTGIPKLPDAKDPLFNERILSAIRDIYNRLGASTAPASARRPQGRGTNGGRER